MPGEHPFLRNFGNPSTRVNLVVTPQYERASERPSIRTDSLGGGGKSQGSPSGETHKCDLFLAG